jgi:hypothetical protein
MPIEFTENETATMIDLLVGTIERYPFPQSPHIRRPRGILEKIRPVPISPSDAGAESDVPDIEEI